MLRIFIVYLSSFLHLFVVTAIPASNFYNVEPSGLSLFSSNSTSYVPLNITHTSSPYRAGGLIYEINIPNTTVRITAAVAEDSPIDPVALHQTLIGTLRTAQAKGRAWGYTSFLRPEDDPFTSDSTIYRECNITLSSESPSRTSRKRLKYGRVVLVLQALNTFLYDGNKWSATLLVIWDNGVCIGTGSIFPESYDPEQVSAFRTRIRPSLDDTSCSLLNAAQL